MKRRTRATLFASLLLLGLVPITRGAGHAATPTDPGATPPALSRFLLSFERNEGQLPERVAFFQRSADHIVAIEREGLVLIPASGVDRASGTAQVLRIRPGVPGEPSEVVGEGRLTTRVHHLGTSDSDRRRRNVPRYAQVRLPGVAPGVDWVVHSRQGALEFDYEVAPNRDAQNLGFSVEGADQIALLDDGRLRLDIGADRIHLATPVAYQPSTDDGDHPEPRREVTARFVLDAETQWVRFALGDYDRSRPLVIDPVVEFSTHLGGQSSVYSVEMQLGPDRDLYVAGTVVDFRFPASSTGIPWGLQDECGEAFYGTASAGCSRSSWNGTEYGASYMPSTEVFRDGYVAKIKQSTPPQIEWITFLGGVEGDSIFDMAVGDDGRVHVVGATRSSEFYATPNAVDDTLEAVFLGPNDRDGFYTVLSADGTTVEYSTFQGGAGDNALTAVALTPEGDAIVAGYYERNVAGNIYDDAIVLKYDETNTPVWTYTVFTTSACPTGTYIHPSALAIRPAGGIYLAGTTTCANQIAGSMTFGPGCASCTTNGEPDAFLWKFRASGTRRFAGFLGGGESDEATDIALTPDGDPVVVGYTYSDDFPIVESTRDFNGGAACAKPGAQLCSDGFATIVFDESATVPPVIASSSYLGGNRDDRIDAIHVTGTAEDPGDGGPINPTWVHDLWVTGTTNSIDFPLIDEFQSSCDWQIPAPLNCSNSAFAAMLRRERRPIYFPFPIIIGFTITTDLWYSSYLGGVGLGFGATDNDHGTGIAVDEYGWIYLGGTGTNDFPLLNEITGSTSSPSNSLYLTRLSPLPEPSGGIPLLVTALVMVTRGRKRPCRGRAARRVN